MTVEVKQGHVRIPHRPLAVAVPRNFRPPSVDGGDRRTRFSGDSGNGIAENGVNAGFQVAGAFQFRNCRFFPGKSLYAGQTGGKKELSNVHELNLCSFDIR